jgi:hypothetical protein
MVLPDAPRVRYNDIPLRKLYLPYDDMGAQGTLERIPQLPADIIPTLSQLFGQTGNNKSMLIRSTDDGHLIVHVDNPSSGGTGGSGGSSFTPVITDAIQQYVGAGVDATLTTNGASILHGISFTLAPDTSTMTSGHQYDMSLCARPSGGGSPIHLYEAVAVKDSAGTLLTPYISQYVEFNPAIDLAGALGVAAANIRLGLFRPDCGVWHAFGTVMS